MSNQRKGDRTPNVEKVEWEAIECHNVDSEGGAWHFDMARLKVDGGWLVSITRNGMGLTFYPDPEHKWNPYEQDGDV